MKKKEDISLSSLVKTTTKNRKRVGRGIGSGHGKTATRGTKGMRARKGSKKGPGFEGGQLPFHLRIPKNRGFKRPWKKSFQVINLDLLESLELKDVNPKILFEKRLISSLFKPVKILGKTELKSPIKIMAHAISKPALERLKAAGGEFQTL